MTWNHRSPSLNPQTSTSCPCDPRYIIGVAVSPTVKLGLHPHHKDQNETERCNERASAPGFVVKAPAYTNVFHPCGVLWGRFSKYLQGTTRSRNSSACPGWADLNVGRLGSRSRLLLYLLPVLSCEGPEWCLTHGG